MIVEFVVEPPVPNVYLGEEHIQSHLCSARHNKDHLYPLRASPTKPIPPDLTHPRENHISFIGARYLFLDRLLP